MSSNAIIDYKFEINNIDYIDAFYNSIYLNSNFYKRMKETGGIPVVFEPDISRTMNSLQDLFIADPFRTIGMAYYIGIDIHASISEEFDYNKILVVRCKLYEDYLFKFIPRSDNIDLDIKFRFIKNTNTGKPSSVIPIFDIYRSKK